MKFCHEKNSYREPTVTLRDFWVNLLINMTSFINTIIEIFFTFKRGKPNFRERWVLLLKWLNLAAMATPPHGLAPNYGKIWKFFRNFRGDHALVQIEFFRARLGRMALQLR